MSDRSTIGPNFDKQYRDYVLKNVARTVRAEMLEAVQRQLEIELLNGLWEESK